MPTPDDAKGMTPLSNAPQVACDFFGCDERHSDACSEMATRSSPGCSVLADLLSRERALMRFTPCPHEAHKAWTCAECTTIRESSLRSERDLGVEMMRMAGDTHQEAVMAEQKAVAALRVATAAESRALAAEKERDALAGALKSIAECPFLHSCGSPDCDITCKVIARAALAARGKGK